jgi:cAMP phosphodiesterase
MRKDWIRTEKERELRQLQKLIKEQKKLNTASNDSQSLINLPIVIRNRKRLMIKSRSQDLIIKPVNTNDRII